MSYNLPKKNTNKNFNKKDKIASNKDKIASNNDYDPKKYNVKDANPPQPGQ